MKVHVIFAVFCCILSVQLTKAQDYDEEPEENLYQESASLKNLIEKNGKFSKEFVKAVSRAQGSYVASPISLWFAMAMTSLGASGETLNEIKRGLNLPEDQNEMITGMNELMGNLHSQGDDVVIKVANQLYIKQGQSLKEDFKTAVRTGFNVTPSQVDFTNPRLSRDINNFIAEFTNNKIRNILPERNAFDSLTKMVLMNAVYFKGLWKTPFDPKDTKYENFYRDERSAFQVPFMKLEFSAKYISNADLESNIIELPYKGTKTSMLIVLPQRKGRLVEVERKIADKDIGNLMRNARYRDVKLSLPKFRVESTLDLDSPMSEMGLHRLFSERAEFDGMSQFMMLKLNKIRQKTYIQVEEESTEAAVVTEVGFVDLAAQHVPRYIEMVVDHPFLFYIIHRTANSYTEERKPVVLFNGRVTEPRI